ncbi:hypothetical protein [Micromonospora echinofusca]|uniref:Uncharacterized protein n=1 Tax=Micromonospora echinofusca TaxID=47858 RepID=A0ABS3VJC9_MICEH|nr:hypothetical protein [Micromonospora echinofusca]MBO4204639.1 hypothetical protein [Micromonospora echinofusca]
MTGSAGTRTPVGELSCYTANLARYLGGYLPDAPGHLARTVRLAVRPAGPGQECPGFSHHAVALCDLGAGRHLAYRGTDDPDGFRTRLGDEIAGYGAALVVTHTGAMPWSPARPEQSAPHFTLVTDRQGDRWRVVDTFGALLPAGPQEPYDGWLTDGQLVDCATAPGPLRPEHRSRLALAFGLPVPVPAGRYRWLAVVAADRPAAPPPGPPGWLTGTAEVRHHLRDLWTGPAADPAHLARIVDDLWAAARHHAFRYTHLMRRPGLADRDRERLAAAVRAWQDVPMALRFAVDSALRGRPRPAVVHTTFAQLDRAEEPVTGLLATHGYLPEPAPDPGGPAAAAAPAGPAGTPSSEEEQ